MCVRTLCECYGAIAAAAVAIVVAVLLLLSS